MSYGDSFIFDTNTNRAATTSGCYYSTPSAECPTVLPPKDVTEPWFGQNQNTIFQTKSCNPAFSLSAYPFPPFNPVDGPADSGQPHSQLVTKTEEMGSLTNAMAAVTEQHYVDNPKEAKRADSEPNLTTMSTIGTAAGSLSLGALPAAAQEQQGPVIGGEENDSTSHSKRPDEVEDVASTGPRPCAVCGEAASGQYFGALVCLPCKSFFIRCTKGREPVLSADCGGKCAVTSRRVRCQFCRFQKCLAAGMCRKEKPEAVVPGEGQVLCKVCCDIANGIHFGVMSCEGCKKFFRRGLKEHDTYVCKASKMCTINPRMRNNCRYCRYQRCRRMGMSRDAIKMGRPKKGEDSCSRPLKGSLERKRKRALHSRKTESRMSADKHSSGMTKHTSSQVAWSETLDHKFTLEAMYDTSFLTDEFLEAVNMGVQGGQSDGVTYSRGETPSMLERAAGQQDAAAVVAMPPLPLPSPPLPPAPTPQPSPSPSFVATPVSSQKPVTSTTAVSSSGSKSAGGMSGGTALPYLSCHLPSQLSTEAFRCSPEVTASLRNLRQASPTVKDSLATIKEETIVARLPRNSCFTEASPPCFCCASDGLVPVSYCDSPYFSQHWQPVAPFSHPTGQQRIRSFQSVPPVVQPLTELGRLNNALSSVLHDNQQSHPKNDLQNVSSSSQLGQQYNYNGKNGKQTSVLPVNNANVLPDCNQYKTFETRINLSSVASKPVRRFSSDFFSSFIREDNGNFVCDTFPAEPQQRSTHTQCKYRRRQSDSVLEFVSSWKRQRLSDSLLDVHSQDASLTQQDPHSFQASVTGTHIPYSNTEVPYCGAQTEMPNRRLAGRAEPLSQLAALAGQALCGDYSGRGVVGTICSEHRTSKKVSESATTQAVGLASQDPQARQTKRFQEFHSHADPDSIGKQKENAFYTTPKSELRTRQMTVSTYNDTQRLVGAPADACGSSHSTRSSLDRSRTNKSDAQSQTDNRFSSINGTESALSFSACTIDENGIICDTSAATNEKESRPRISPAVITVSSNLNDHCHDSRDGFCAQTLIFPTPTRGISATRNAFLGTVPYPKPGHGEEYPSTPHFVQTNGWTPPLNNSVGSFHNHNSGPITDLLTLEDINRYFLALDNSCDKCVCGDKNQVASGGPLDTCLLQSCRACFAGEEGEDADRGQLCTRRCHRYWHLHHDLPLADHLAAHDESKLADLASAFYLLRDRLGQLHASLSRDRQDREQVETLGQLNERLQYESSSITTLTKEFMMQIPGCENLATEDVSMLSQNHGVGCVLILLGSQVYNAESGRFRELWAESQTATCPLFHLKEQLLDVGGNVHLMAMDKTETLLLCALCLFSTDISGLKDKEAIQKVRTSLLYGLETYISTRDQWASVRVKRLLSVLPDVRLVSAWYNAVLRHVNQW